jgi:hypothetical protein
MANHPVEPKGFMAHAVSFVKLKQVDQCRRDYLQDVWLILEGADIADPMTLMAPFMREALESTSATPSEIETKFGPGVLKLVAELTLDPGLDEPTWRAVQLERAPMLSDPAKVVLFAEAIANLGKLREDCSIKENQDYIDWVDNLADAVSGVNSQLDALCEKMIEHARDLVDAARRYRPPATIVPARGRKPKKPKKKRPDSHFLRMNAERGVGSVEITWDEDIAHVTIDGRQILLPPLSGHALDVAAFFSEVGNDGFPLLLDKKAFGRELGHRTGGTYEDPHHINMVLYRLQDKLSENGLNRLLVEMPPGCSVRFRVRRTAPNPSPVPEPGELVGVP